MRLQRAYRVRGRQKTCNIPSEEGFGEVWIHVDGGCEGDQVCVRLPDEEGWGSVDSFAKRRWYSVCVGMSLESLGKAGEWAKRNLPGGKDV